MDGKDIISPSDLHFYGQQQHRAPLGSHHHSPSSSSHSPHLSGTTTMHSVVRPMPNMSMSATAILNSIGAGGMPSPFQMDDHPPLMPHGNNSNMVSVSATTTVAPPDPPVKRKRGRPRKYGPDGTMTAKASSAAHQRMVGATTQPRMGSLSAVEDPAQKKRRGRPPGTGKKQHLPAPSGNAFSGTAGTSFTPHIITASPSEDVAAKIVAFANQSSKAVCVLSATGSVSRVVLRHPTDACSPMSSRLPHAAAASAPYKNPDIYEGFYEILSLSGSYTPIEGSSQDQQQQTAGLSVTLCGPERNVIGGVLGGALVAASAVQVVLGSFHQAGLKSKSKKAGRQQGFSSDSLTGGAAQEASPSSGHNQNLTPPSAGGWPGSGIFDTNIDINSSRG